MADGGKRRVWVKGNLEVIRVATVGVEVCKAPGDLPMYSGCHLPTPSPPFPISSYYVFLPEILRLTSLVAALAATRISHPPPLPWL